MGSDVEKHGGGGEEGGVAGLVKGQRGRWKSLTSLQSLA